MIRPKRAEVGVVKHAWTLSALVVKRRGCLEGAQGAAACGNVRRRPRMHGKVFYARARGRGSAAHECVGGVLYLAAVHCLLWEAQSVPRVACRHQVAWSGASECTLQAAAAAAVAEIGAAAAAETEAAAAAETAAAAAAAAAEIGAAAAAETGAAAVAARTASAAASVAGAWRTRLPVAGIPAVPSHLRHPLHPLRPLPGHPYPSACSARRQPAVAGVPRSAIVVRGASEDVTVGRVIGSVICIEKKACG